MRENYAVARGLSCAQLMLLALALAACNNDEQTALEAENTQLKERMVQLTQENAELARELEAIYNEQERDLARFDQMMRDLSSKVSEQRDELERRAYVMEELERELERARERQNGETDPKPPQRNLMAEQGTDEEASAPGGAAVTPAQKQTLEDVRTRLRMGNRTQVVLALGRPDTVRDDGARWRYDDKVFDPETRMDRDLVVTFEEDRVQGVNYR